MTKLKDVYDLIDGVCLVKNEDDDTIHYSNTSYLKSPKSEMMKKEIKAIKPFYWKGQLFKYGVIIILKR